MLLEIKLSSEQQFFIDCALNGENILVDACIGSGKTTAIQYLCNKIPINKRVLYLTYNKLLKIDAKSKIRQKNVTVTNYHGFAASMLRRNGVMVSVNDLIKTFNESKPIIPKYDILIIDEYQDIELEFAVMLQYIKKKNENIQIIAVGDMEQKIYDKTTLDVMKFIDEFLGDYTRMSFTNCFRLSKDLAARLGRIWSKNIIGVNENCKIVSMNVNEVTRFLLDEAPEDILCLGARTGTMVDVLNILEKEKPDKFNKKTVYASIKESDSVGKIEPKSNSAIFTTYDSSKGLERKICVVFDYTESYWAVRSSHPMQKYEILRNIFCVAASRGKNVIVFVDEDETALSEETMSCNFETSYKFDNVGISTMFEFKYKEDIEECYNLLKLEEIINEDCNIIDIKSSDELIDLSPCIGIYQKECFFTYKDIDKDIKLVFDLNKNLFYNKNILKKNTIDQKILYLTSLNTKQLRYVNQVIPPFVSEDDSNRIKNRLAQYFSRDEDVQIDCRIEFRESDSAEVSFEAVGFADVVKNNIVYVIKFLDELSHENFLECACYMIALKLEKGVLLNTRSNRMYELEIPNKNEFMNAVVKTITKGKIKRYYSDYS